MVTASTDQFSNDVLINSAHCRCSQLGRSTAWAVEPPGLRFRTISARPDTDVRSWKLSGVVTWRKNPTNPTKRLW